MPIINQHGEEVSVKGDRFSVKPRGGHFCVLQKDIQREGAVEISRHKLGQLIESHAGGQKNEPQLNVWLNKYDKLVGNSVCGKNVGNL